MGEMTGEIFLRVSLYLKGFPLIEGRDWQNSAIHSKKLRVFIATIVPQLGKNSSLVRKKIFPR